MSDSTSDNLIIGEGGGGREKKKRSTGILFSLCCEQGVDLDERDHSLAVPGT